MDNRATMVREQLVSRGIHHAGVLAAMAAVPREEFVPEAERGSAYADGALPIGHDQTISQPYIVALMTELLDPRPADRVLEIGTGSGYQTAILAQVVGEVYSMEILEPLAAKAAATLAKLSYPNIHLRTADGYHGWPEAAPFDAVMVTCAPEAVPEPLIDQVAVGGRLILPVGPPGQVQVLYRFDKGEAGLLPRAASEVRFVPMTRGGRNLTVRAPGQ